MGDGYKAVSAILGAIVGLITFLWCWGYAISQWGWFIGLGVGWFPASIIAILAGFATFGLWPLAALGIVLLIAHSM